MLWDVIRLAIREIDVVVSEEPVVSIFNLEVSPTLKIEAAAIAETLMRATLEGTEFI